MSNNNCGPSLSHTSAGHRLAVRADGIRAAQFLVADGGRIGDRAASPNRIAVVVRGEGTLVVEQDRRRVRAGDVLDFLSGKIHRIDARGELEVVLLESESLWAALATPTTR
jgi:quercetin dioxygenase-like cupin family protein